MLFRSGKSIRGAKVLVLGLSYKPDIDDDRESPSFEIIDRLQELGAAVSYCDPHIPKTKKVRKYDLGLKSTPCSEEEFARHDVLIVATAHNGFRTPGLFRLARLVVDTRNLLSPDALDGPLIRA